MATKPNPQAAASRKENTKKCKIKQRRPKEPKREPKKLRNNNPEQKQRKITKALQKCKIFKNSREPYNKLRQ